MLPGTGRPDGQRIPPLHGTSHEENGYRVAIMPTIS